MTPGVRVVAGLWRLSRAEYRAALPASGLAAEEPLATDRATIVFVHGVRGAPSQFASLVARIEDANRVAFAYHDFGPLVPPAEVLRGALGRLPPPVVVVAHSLGTLLPAYVGATDRTGTFASLGALYVNPLVGGARWADADPALAVLGELRGLRWLHGVKRLVQRAMPAVVRDLTPESHIQQAIFHRGGAPSSFARRTVVVSTDEPGNWREIRPDRFVRHFGHSRAEALRRTGRVVEIAPEQAIGHQAPLQEPALTLPLLRELLAAQPSELRRA